MDRYLCDITLVSPWHDKRSSTEQMLLDISASLNKNSPRTRDQTVDFVFASNLLEREGTDNYNETREILLDERDITLNPVTVKTPLRRVTAQTFYSLQYLADIRSENAEEQTYHNLEITALTEDVIKSAHRKLMCGLIPAQELGYYRKTTVKPSGYDFCYEKPENIETRMIQYLDRYNDVVLCRRLGVEQDLFKFAAWTLFEFVDIHPFTDGNGRLCRLLANHVLSAFLSFPVYIHTSPHFSEHEKWRTHYIDCIQQAREKRDLSYLTSLLIKSVWLQLQDRDEN